MPRLVGPVVAPGTMREQEQPVLRAEGLTLRPWTAEDASAVVEAHEDPAIRRWHTRSFDSTEEAAEWAGSWGERWREETGADWAIADGRTGALLGRTALRSISLWSGFAEVTYWVVPSARRSGVASRGTERLARWALDELGMHRLELLHSVANESSCRVAHRIGFLLEGTLRGALLHTDGWHDAHLHARLEDGPVSSSR